MDANFMSCPTCGHAVSNKNAGACAYCGAIFSKGGAKAQSDEKIAAEETPATVSEPPVKSAARPPAAETSKDPDNAGPAADKPSESILSQQEAAETIAADSAEAEPPPEDYAAEADIKLEDASAEKEQADAIDPEAVRYPPDSKSDPLIDLKEEWDPEPVSPAEPMSTGDLMPASEATAEAESRSVDGTHRSAEKQGEDESEPEEMPLSQAPEVLEATAQDPDELETLGAEIIEMIEAQASEDETPRSKASDEGSFPDTTAGATQDRPADNGWPKATPETAAEKQAGLKSESRGDTILLEPDDEVQIPSVTATDKSGEKTKVEALKRADAAKDGSGAAAAEPTVQKDVLKIEKAARDMKAAIEQQKEKQIDVGNTTDKKTKTAKALALKKQKAALAKAEAEKKQKLLLAKAAALKRKKAAEAKAQALKKQREAAAGSEISINENAAAASQRVGTKTAAVRELKPDSGIQDLLKKYEGQAIGINYDNSAEIREALLERANHEYFSVFVKDKQLYYNYPLRTILTVIEGKDGVETGSSKQPQKFNAVIKVYPLVLF
jgi:hypothetical protein